MDQGRETEIYLRYFSWTIMLKLSEREHKISRDLNYTAGLSEREMI